MLIGCDGDGIFSIPSPCAPCAPSPPPIPPPTPPGPPPTPPGPPGLFAFCEGDGIISLSGSGGRCWGGGCLCWEDGSSGNCCGGGWRSGC